MKKTEIPGIYKMGEGILINTDNEALRAYKLRKEKENRFCLLEQNLTELKSDMEEIKNILKGLVK
jgi:hypothetical protein